MSDKDTDKDASGQTPGPIIEIIECKACGRCVAACPKGLLVMSEDFNERGYHYVRYKGDGCLGCASCFYTCPEPGAIAVRTPARKKRED